MPVAERWRRRPRARPRSRTARAPATAASPVVRISSSSSYRAGSLIRALRLDDRQRDTRRLPSRDSSSPSCAQQIGPADLEPDEVVGVVDHAHLVGFGVAHAHARDGRAERSPGRRRRRARRRAPRLELARRPLGIGRVEDRLAGDEDPRAGGDDAGDVAEVDAAVDLDRRGVARRGRAARAPPGL